MNAVSSFTATDGNRLDAGVAHGAVWKLHQLSGLAEEVLHQIGFVVSGRWIVYQ